MGLLDRIGKKSITSEIYLLTNPSPRIVSAAFTMCWGMFPSATKQYSNHTSFLLTLRFVNKAVRMLNLNILTQYKNEQIY